jgi:hypothetical protein
MKLPKRGRYAQAAAALAASDLDADARRVRRSGSRALLPGRPPGPFQGPLRDRQAPRGRVAEAAQEHRRTDRAQHREHLNRQGRGRRAREPSSGPHRP